MNRQDEFFVGYAEQAPPRLGRWLTRVVAVPATAACVVAGILAWAQNELPSGKFEFGTQRAFQGVLYETPLPTLRVSRADGAVATFLLSGFGKQGLPDVARGRHGSRVGFDGTLVYRENMTMVEITDPSTFRILGPPLPEPARGPFEVLGPVTLVGEIVDTKCYLGVMRPATGKVHRACAVRCLSGGVPPGLLVRTSAESGAVFLLIGDDGGPLRLDPEWAARLARVRGKLELHDGLAVVKVARVTLVAGPADHSGPALAGSVSLR